MAYIPSGKRKQMDALRRNGVMVSNRYAKKLAALRKKETLKILETLEREREVRQWSTFFGQELNEGKYLPAWWQGLIMNSALPAAKVTTTQLIGKNDINDDIFTRQLQDFAQRRAGREITSVSHTFKESIQQRIGKELLEDPNIGVEKLARAIRAEVDHIALWQARRIAQTEMMIGLAEASHEAAEYLQVKYLKQWSISGLGNTRETHELMDGVIVAADEMFILEDCEMMYPSDPSAPASEIINCACTCIYLNDR